MHSVKSDAKRFIRPGEGGRGCLSVWNCGTWSARCRLADPRRDRTMRPAGVSANANLTDPRTRRLTWPHPTRLRSVLR